MKYEEYLAIFNFLCVCYIVTENIFLHPRRVKKYQADIGKGIIKHLENSDSVLFIKEDKVVMKDRNL